MVRELAHKMCMYVPGNGDNRDSQLVRLRHDPGQTKLSPSTNQLFGNGLDLFIMSIILGKVFFGITWVCLARQSLGKPVLIFARANCGPEDCRPQW